MPSYAAPYAPTRQYDYSQARSIGDLQRARLDVQAQQQQRRGDASAQTWSNVGASAAGTINSILKERQDAPIRAQAARVAALNEARLTKENAASDLQLAAATRNEEARVMVENLPYYASGEGRNALLASLPATARDLITKQYQDLDEHAARMGQIAASTAASTASTAASAANTQQSQQAIAQGNIDLFGLIGYHVANQKYNPAAYYAGVADAVGKKLITLDEAGPLVAKALEHPEAIKAITDTWIQHSPATLDRIAKETAATSAQRNVETDNAELHRHDLAMETAAQTTANATAMRARATSMGLDETVPPVYQNAIERALIGVVPTRRPQAIALINSLWAQGDTKQMAEVIKQSAIANENVDTKNLVLGRMTTLASLKDTRDMLNELKAAGVPTNIVTGTVEDVARKLGKSTNTKYVELGNRLMGTLINYRRAATGVQFSAPESADYAKMFPNYRNDLPVNIALIDGLEREIKTYDRTYWEYKLGPGGAQLVGVGNGATTTPQAGPAEIVYDANGNPVK